MALVEVSISDPIPIQRKNEKNPNKRYEFEIVEMPYFTLSKKEAVAERIRLIEASKTNPKASSQLMDLNEKIQNSIC